MPAGTEGEEFGIILPGTNISNDLDVAEKIRAVVEKMEHIYSGHRIRITLSAGISSLAQCINKSGRDKPRTDFISEMTDMADIALYNAKASKCHSCSFIAGLNTEIEGHKCPLCGSETISDRNRVEIFSTGMHAFDSSDENI